MNSKPSSTMRDALIERIYERMGDDENIFFLSADMGAPVLDRLRAEFPDRFINVGIAEQNLVSVAAGLALEGFTVYAYGLAPFVTMRAYEQIRISLALLSEHRQVNVNLMGVGAGISYEVSGPTHHCLEDLAIIRALPNLTLCSASDCRMAREFVDYSIDVKGPKYIRLDGKPVAALYHDDAQIDWNRGYNELGKGEEICMVATGYMTQQASEVVRVMSQRGVPIGLIDVFLLKPLDEKSLAETLSCYSHIVTLEDGFKHTGGLDSLIMKVTNKFHLPANIEPFGFDDKYVFEFGPREHLYELCGFSKDQIITAIEGLLVR